MRHRPPRAVRLAVLIAAAAVVAAGAAATVTNAALHREAEPFTFDDAGAVPTRPVALVFGTEVLTDGRLSPRLADRVHAAVALHRAGRVGTLIMTGDHHRPDYDEVDAMRDAAVAAGVPAADIRVDPEGLDTYDSCVRARTVLGVSAAVLVTQAYHLPRALYLCRHQGIDAVGLAVPDWQHHPERSGTTYDAPTRARHTVREWLARVNAPIDTVVLHRSPAVPG